MANRLFLKPYWRTIALCTMVTISSVSVGCGLLPEEQGVLKPPLLKPAQATVRTVDVEIGTIVKEISGAAHFVPTRISYHPFLGRGGSIKSVEVRAGDTVTKGDVLVTLNNGDIDVELLQKELEFEKKKFAYEDAVDGGDKRQIRIAKLDYELAKLLLDKTRKKAESAILRAQEDGVVTFVADLQPGDQVQDGQVLVAISDPRGMRVALNAAGNPVMKDIRVGMEADIIFKGNTYSGKVTQTPSSAPFTKDERLRDEYTKTLYIEMEELPSEATIGEMADVKIIAARRENVVVLPKRGIRTYFGRTYVQIMDGERRREIDVELGLENSTEVEVIKGLEPGMKVILQ